MPDDVGVGFNTGQVSEPFGNWGYFPGMQGQAGYNVQESMGYPANWGSVGMGGGAGGGGGGGGGGLKTQNTLTPEQQSILGLGSAGVSRFLGNTGGYSPMNAFSPAETIGLYNQFFGPQEQLTWENQTNPRIQEAFVGPGTYWSGARAAAQADAAAQAQALKMQNIANMFMQDRASARQSLLPFALGLLGANTGVTYGEPSSQGASGDFAGLLRELLGKYGLQGAGTSSGLIEGPANTPGWNPQLGGDIWNNMQGAGLGGGGLGGANSLLGFMGGFTPQTPAASPPVTPESFYNQFLNEPFLGGGAY